MGWGGLVGIGGVDGEFLWGRRLVFVRVGVGVVSVIVIAVAVVGGVVERGWDV